MVPQHAAEPGAGVGGGGPEEKAGKGLRREGSGAANRRAAHQLTAFAYTRCTPAAGSTKPGAPRAPAASRGARRGPRSRARSALRAGRGAGGVSLGSGTRAVASLAAPGAFLWTWPHTAPPSAPHFSYPPSQSCLPLPRSPSAGRSPGRRSSCCWCRCLAASPSAPPGAPKEPACAAGWEGGAAQPVLLLCLLLPPPLPGPCAPRHPRQRASG